MSAKLRLMDARAIAQAYLGDLGTRWIHAQTTGKLAEATIDRARLKEDVAVAAWLHDIGYAISLRQTGFHPLDGARFLQDYGVSPNIVALVAHHTGASFEAQERGLTDDLDALPLPNPVDLDALTLLDLVVGPSGEMTTPEHRIEEILMRYNEDDPVHRAVTRSQRSLLAAAQRARSQLGLSDEWPLDLAEGVLES